MNQTSYELKFKTEYEKLNTEQKQAVDTIFGPVMVIAGPGTGKTQILALRIAHLLRSDAQIAPQNILCLTYTDEGKKNMRDRLFKLVGAETAQKIGVHSYHSFCNEVIQQNLSYFNKENLEPITELEKIEFVKKILYNLKDDNLLYNPKNPNKYVKKLQGVFQKMKQENWSTQYLIPFYDRHISNLENDPENISKSGKSKGKLKVAAIDEIEKFQSSKDTVKLFDAYQNSMHEHERYDFDDMINWVIQLFETNEDILQSYQEKYQFILIDEFQDTNGSQMKVAELLTNYDDSPNVFVVGDDDQSIYRFQGASVENMIQFQKKYKEHGLREICLKINYRSTQGILDQAKRLIEKVSNRLIDTNENLDKNLRSFMTDEFQENSIPQLFQLKDPRHERIFIAKEIQRLIREGVNPKEIAVLYYKNDDGLELSRYLKLLDIPFYSRKNLNILKEQISLQVLNILRFIAMERENSYSADEILFQILHYHFWEISPIEIAKASIESNEKQAANRKTRYSFRRFLAESIQNKNGKLFIENPEDQLFNAVAKLETLIQDSHNLSLLQLIDKVIHDCGIMKFVLKSPDKFELIETLSSLFDFIKTEAHNNTDLNISQLLEYINILDENNIEIPITKIYGNEDSVRLFTIHGSKGREYEHVFVAGLINSKWEDKRNNSDGFRIPPEVLQSAQNNKDKDELRRLLYVAFTRAKKGLYVSYSNLDQKDKEAEKSIFLYETFGETYEATKIELDKETVSEFESLMSLDIQSVQVKQLEKDYINARLENFVMNATALNNYLDCPLHFYYNNIIRIPSALNENMSFGSAIHYALEKLFTNMKNNGNVFPSLEEFEKYFLFSMQKNKEKFSIEGMEKKTEYGMIILQKLYEKNIHNWHQIVNVEFSAKAIFNEIPLKGFIDKIEYYDSNKIQLVDYKTGDSTSAYTKEKMKTKDADKNNIGGDYWRQAMFYKILLDNDPNNKYEVECAKFEFVEPNKKSKEIEKPTYFHFDRKQVEQVEQQIVETWNKIKNHEFYEGCGKEKCMWCDMAIQSGA